MNYLITGGAGFIGSNLTEDLLAEGHNVVVVDNLTTGKKDNVLSFLANPNFEFYELAIESGEFLKQFLNYNKNFDRVYHLACPTGVPNIEKLGENMLMACSIGTQNVLQVALKHKAKFLFTSSSEVYGEPLVTPQTEEYTGNVDPIGPRANYEEGKRFSETLVKWFVDHYGLDAKTVRLFNVYGPKMSLDDTRVVSRLAAQALTGQGLSVQGQGLQRRTFCYVSDLIAGLKLVIEKGEKGRVYNLGSDQDISIVGLAQLILSLTESKSTIEFIPRPQHDHNSRMPDLSRVRALGWQNGVALKQGLLQTLAYFKEKLTISTNTVQ